MKFIKDLTIDYLFFLNNFNELKKMKIDSLEVSSIAISTSNPQYVHLNSEIIIQNFDKIEKFLIENDPKQKTTLDKYEKYYLNISYSYLMHLYKQNKLDFNDPILLKTPRFIFYLFKFNDKNKFNQETIKKLEDGLLRDIKYAYNYVFDVLKKPWKKLEENPEYFNHSDIDLKLQYISKIVIDNIDLKNSNKHYVYAIFDYLTNNPTYKKDLDLFLSSNNLLEYSLRNIFSSHYFKQLDEYILKNHPKSYGLFYYLLDISFLNKKIEEYNLEEVMNRVYEVPEALISVINRFQNNKNFINDILKNSDIINKNILNDVESLVWFLNFIIIKKNDYFMNFMKNHPQIIDLIIKKLDDDLILSSFMYCFIYYESRDLKDEDFLSDKKIERIRELFEKKYPYFLQKISQYSKSSLYYAISARKQFIEGEKAIFEVPFHKQQYLEMLKRLGPQEVKNYDHYDFSEIK